MRNQFLNGLKDSAGFDKIKLYLNKSSVQNRDNLISSIRSTLAVNFKTLALVILIDYVLSLIRLDYFIVRMTLLTIFTLNAIVQSTLLMAQITEIIRKIELYDLKND